MDKEEKCVDGDIYWNPFFGDLWIVDGSDFVKINDGYRAEIEEVVGFVKVGYAVEEEKE